MKFEELKSIALNHLNPQRSSKYCEYGGVAASLVTDKGNVYSGVCIDVSSSMGFCAEHSAIAQMVTNGETRIMKIVAVVCGTNTVIPPCGRCREFIYQVDNRNIDTEVMVSETKIVTIRKLLPFRWDGEN